MAVEARHLNLFPPQIITNRDFLCSNEGIGSIYNTQVSSGVPFPGPMPETLLLPFHHQPLVSDAVPVRTPTMKAEDSGITYNVAVALRKRSRDSLVDPMSTFPVPQQQNNQSDQLSSLLPEEILPLQIHQQHQLEIDHLVAEHTKKLKLELEESQKQYGRVLVSAIGQRVMKKLREKDDQIQRMGKLNWFLQERVKSLYVENQVWRQSAQSNEATANSLRTNLEQVLAQVSDERLSAGGGGALADDAVSCCGSNDDHGGEGEENEGEEEEEEERRMLAGGEGDRKGVKDKEVVGGDVGNRMCRMCRERESSVLLLPCRHLCLCNLCGSTALHTCPVCNSCMNASLHVNIS